MLEIIVVIIIVSTIYFFGWWGLLSIILLGILFSDSKKESSFSIRITAIDEKEAMELAEKKYNDCFVVRVERDYDSYIKHGWKDRWIVEMDKVNR